MRKIILLVLTTLLLAGCANDQYAIEKRYWKLQQQANKIFNNPDASPPNQLEKVVENLKNFTIKFPENFLAINADFNIARLYLVKKEYNKARSHLRGLIGKYDKYSDVGAEAVFLIGNAYEIEDKWDVALDEYQKVIREYAATRRGLDVPIYIAQHYKMKHQPEKMLAAYQEAIAHYNALAQKYPDTALAYNSSMSAANCYVAMKEWLSAINVLNSIANKYKGKVNTDSILLNIALIYNKELKDKVKAKETLERLVKEYPQSRFTKIATVLLKELDKDAASK